MRIVDLTAIEEWSVFTHAWGFSACQRLSFRRCDLGEFHTRQSASCIL